MTDLLIASTCIASCVLIAACSPALNEDAASETASAHVNASTVEWNVSEIGERRSNRIICGESIPDGDRSVYDGGYRYVEPLPEQAPEAVFPASTQ